jgi:hypothetical protein
MDDDCALPTDPRPAPPPSWRLSAVPAFLTTAEVAEELGLTPGRVRQLADAHGLGARYPGLRLFSRGDLERMRTRNRLVGRPKRSENAG